MTAALAAALLAVVVLLTACSGEPGASRGSESISLTGTGAATAGPTSSSDAVPSQEPPAADIATALSPVPSSPPPTRVIRAELPEVLPLEGEFQSMPEQLAPQAQFPFDIGIRLTSDFHRPDLSLCIWDGSSGWGRCKGAGTGGSFGTSVNLPQGSGDVEIYLLRGSSETVNGIPPRYTPLRRLATIPRSEMTVFFTLRPGYETLHDVLTTAPPDARGYLEPDAEALAEYE